MIGVRLLCSILQPANTSLGKKAMLR